MQMFIVVLLTLVLVSSLFPETEAGPSAVKIVKKKKGAPAVVKVKKPAIAVSKKTAVAAKKKTIAAAKKQGVGAKKPASMNRIVGGDIARPNEFPYQLAFEIGGRVQCGASLIAPQWALSAAHCTPGLDPDDVVLIGGEHNLDKEEGHEQRRGAAEIIDHESYRGEDGQFQHDITLIKLQSPFKIDKFVEPIALAPANFKAKGNATVTGWGDTVEGDERGTPKLRKVTLPLVSNADCKEAYDPHPITNGHVCAGFLNEGGKDACQGDSGGPLAVLKSGKPLLIGVVSIGSGCAQPDYPGVFTNVATYRSWIDAHIK